MSAELSPSVVYREGPLTPADYQEAIDFLVEAKRNLETGHHYCPCGDSCSINSCHHNPLVMARRGAAKNDEYKCFHCGTVCVTDEQCREHFGEKQDALPACLKNTQLLIALMKAAVQLAIVRHDLNSEENHTLEEPVDADAIAEDAANAARGIDTCSPETIAEWQAFFTENGEISASDVYARLLAARDQAEKDAIKNLARYKFSNYGYHAARWVTLNRIIGDKKPNPFSEFVLKARAIQSPSQIDEQPPTPCGLPEGTWATS